MDKNKPIGVFDSGLGGLTVVKSLIKNLPNENIIYFGDTGRVPYGDRSKETLIEYVTQDINFLLKHDVKAVVIACNTADSAARQEMEQFFTLPIVGVVAPAGIMAAKTTKNGNIGVIGTKATVNSGAYEKVIKEFNPDLNVFSVACPLLVPMVEEGRINKGDIVIETLLEDYLSVLEEKNIDTLILGCTHYPLLYDIIKEILPHVNIISSGEASTQSLYDVLKENDLLNNSEKNGKISYFVSDAPESFAEHGGFFIGKQIKSDVKKINLGE